MPDVDQSPYVYVDFYFENGKLTISVTAHTMSAVRGYENSIVMLLMKEYLTDHFCDPGTEHSLELREPNHEMVLMQDYFGRYNLKVGVIGFEFTPYTQTITDELIDALKITFSMEITWWLGRDIEFIDRIYGRYRIADPTPKEIESEDLCRSNVEKPVRRVIKPRVDIALSDSS